MRTRVDWLQPPLFVNAGQSPVVVGVAADRWYVKRADEAVPGDSKPGSVALLPLLQDGYGGDFDQVVDGLLARLNAARLAPTLVATFPFQAIVLSALVSSWADLARRWIPEVPWFSDGLVQLRECVADTRIPQRVRQDVSHVLKQHRCSFREPCRVLFHLDGRCTKVLLLRSEGVGMADGGIWWDIPTESIPAHLRAINSRIVVTRWHNGLEHVGPFDVAEWAGP